MRTLHVGHVQLDALESISRQSMTFEQLATELGGLDPRSRQLVRQSAERLLERGLLSRRRGVLHLSPLGTRALSRSLAAGRHPGVPGSPRSYGGRHARS